MRGVKLPTVNVRRAALVGLACGLTLAMNSCRLPLFSGSDVCTLVGCLDGLSVHFDGDLPDVYTIDVDFPDGSMRSATCEWDRFPGGATLIRQETSDVGVFCQLDGARFGGDAPTEATLTVTIDGGAPDVRTVQPAIERSFPNGEDCPPECVTATVVFTI